MAGKGTTIQLSRGDANYLERRGAASHRGGGTFSRSGVLGRMFEALRHYQDASDPRKVSGLPEEMHAALVRAVPEPWALKRYEIETLEGLLCRSPAVVAAMAAAGLDAAAVFAAVARMSIGEKLTRAAARWRRDGRLRQLDSGGKSNGGQRQYDSDQPRGSADDRGARRALAPGR